MYGIAFISLRYEKNIPKFPDEERSMGDIVIFMKLYAMFHSPSILNTMLFIFIQTKFDTLPSSSYNGTNDNKMKTEKKIL